MSRPFPGELRHAIVIILAGVADESVVLELGNVSHSSLAQNIGQASGISIFTRFSPDLGSAKDPVERARREPEEKIPHRISCLLSSCVVLCAPTP